MCSGGATVAPYPSGSERLPDVASTKTTSLVLPTKTCMTPQASLSAPDSADLISCVAKALVLAIESPREVSSVPPEQAAVAIFDSSVVPNVTVEKYLKRLKSVFQCSDAVFVLALIIVDRLLEKPDIEPHRITNKNVHRLYLASLIVTVKFNEDLVYGNSHYARAGGIQLREVNRLERFFLRALDYNFHVHPEQYELYERSLREYRYCPSLGGAPWSPKEAAQSPTKCEIPSCIKGQLQDRDGTDCTRSRCAMEANYSQTITAKLISECMR